MPHRHAARARSSRVNLCRRISGYRYQTEQYCQIETTGRLAIS